MPYENISSIVYASSPKEWLDLVLSAGWKAVAFAAGYLPWAGWLATTYSACWFGIEPYATRGDCFVLGFVYPGLILDYGLKSFRVIYCTSVIYWQVEPIWD